MLSGAGGLDCGVQRKEVCLVGNVGDQLDDIVDLPHLVVEGADLVYGLLGDPLNKLHLLRRDFAERGRFFPFFRRLCGLVHDLLRRACDLLDRRREVVDILPDLFDLVELPACIFRRLLCRGGNLLGGPDDLVGALADLFCRQVHLVPCFCHFSEECADGGQRSVVIVLDDLERVVVSCIHKRRQVALCHGGECFPKLFGAFGESLFLLLCSLHQVFNLLFSLPLLRDIVVDGENRVQIAGTVEERDVVPIKEVGAGRELYCCLSVACLPCPYSVENPLSRLGTVFEVLCGEPRRLVFGVPREFQERLVCHLQGRIRVPEEDRHRVLLNHDVRLFLQFLDLFHLFLLFGPVVPDVEGHLDLAFLVEDGDGVQGEVFLHAVGPLDHDVASGEFFRLVAGVEVHAVEDGDVVVVEFLCKGLFPGPPPHPDVLVVDIDPALVRAERRDCKRVLLDHRIDAAPYPPAFLLPLPLPGEIVVDDEDALDLVLLVEKRNAILLKCMGPRG